MKFVVTFLTFLFLADSSWAQNQQLKVYVDAKQYFEPTSGNFVEINFQFVAPSVRFKGIENGLKGELAIFLDILKDGDTLVKDAYRLDTPLMQDSIIEDFYDIRRFALQPGKYDLRLQIFDLIANSDPVTGSIKFTIDDKSKDISFSDVQNIEFANKGKESSVFFKSGLEIVPRMSNYYPEQLNSLPFYTEVYNSDLLNIPEFGVKQSIFNMDLNTELENYTLIYRYKTDKVVPVLRQIDITQLPTGNYNLSLSIINSDMKVVSEKRFSFERSNNDTYYFDENIALDPAFENSIPKDSISYYLASLLPLVKGESANKILRALKEKDDEKSLRMIQSFWLSSKKVDAYASWLHYKSQVQYTERLFANNFMEGFETDRGRVYLQYGAPSTIIAQETSTDEFPYEIWQYNQIGKTTNKHFVFYNPDLINNNYLLLHSDLIGEKKNMNWAAALRYRNAYSGDTDNQDTGAPDTFNGQFNQQFRNF